MKLIYYLVDNPLVSIPDTLIINGHTSAIAYVQAEMLNHVGISIVGTTFTEAKIVRGGRKMWEITMTH